MIRLIAAAVSAALLLAAVVAVLQVVLVAGLVTGLVLGGRWLWHRHRVSAAVDTHRRGELLARAEIQHRWFMAGDPRGTYGRYPPAFGAW